MPRFLGRAITRKIGGYEVIGSPKGGYGIYDGNRVVRC